MSVDYDIWAIVAAFVVSMVGGMVWYHPKVAGEKWMKAVGLTQKQADADQAGGMILATLRAAILAVVQFQLIFIFDSFYTDNSFLVNALLVSFTVGAAFTWITIAMHDRFDQHPRMATKIHIGFEILTIMLAGAAIGVIAG